MTDHPHDRDIQALRELLEARIRSLELSIEKSERVMNVRLESMNEWRTMTEGNFSRTVQAEPYRCTLQRIDEQISKLAEWQQRMDGAMWLLYTLATSGAVALLIQFVRMYAQLWRPDAPLVP